MVTSRAPHAGPGESRSSRAAHLRGKVTRRRCCGVGALVSARWGLRLSVRSAQEAIW
jgi:hypothetical protein